MRMVLVQQHDAAGAEGQRCQRPQPPLPDAGQGGTDQPAQEGRWQIQVAIAFAGHRQRVVRSVYSSDGDYSVGV